MRIVSILFTFMLCTSCLKHKNCVCADSTGKKSTIGYAEARTQKQMNICNDNCKMAGDPSIGYTCQLE